MNTDTDGAEPGICGKETLVAGLEHHRSNHSKYHETLVIAWNLALRHFMEKTMETDSADVFINRTPEMPDSKIMMTHYSK